MAGPTSAPVEPAPDEAGPLRPVPFGEVSRKVVVAALALLGLVLVVSLRGLLTLVLFSVLLAYVLAPAVDGIVWLAYRAFRRPLPRWAAILVVLVWLTSVLVLAGVFLLPSLAEQTAALAGRVPDYYEQVQGIVEDLRRMTRRELPPRWRQAIEGYLAQVGSAVFGFVQRSALAVVGWVVSVLGVVLIPIFTFFVLEAAPGMRPKLLAWFPPAYRPEVDFLVSEANVVMFRFLRGRLIVAACIAVLISAGNWAIGVPYPLVLGVAAGLFDLVPFVGPILAAIPAVVLSLLEAPGTALWVVGLYVAVQQVENFVLSPKIEGGHLELNAGLVIFAATAAGSLFGILGVLLAIPITALSRVLLLYVRAKLRGEPLRPLGAAAAEDDRTRGERAA